MLGCFFSFALLNSHLIGAPDLMAQYKQLERDWAPIEKPTENLDPRALIGFSLEATALKWHPERVAYALTVLEQMQDRDTTSKTYGNFRWYMWQPKPIDLNAVEFTMQQAILLWNLYGSSLDKKSRDRLEKLINLSVDGIKSHPVSVSYTNIYVMKTWNLIAIGEAFKRDDIAHEGYAMLQNWMDYTYHNGIQEYLSPTYYSVDINSLSLLNKFAKQQQDRESAQKALQLIYWQCRANWFAPNERLSGWLQCLVLQLLWRTSLCRPPSGASTGLPQFSSRSALRGCRLAGK